MFQASWLPTSNQIPQPKGSTEHSSRGLHLCPLAFVYAGPSSQLSRPCAWLKPPSWRYLSFYFSDLGVCHLKVLWPLPIISLQLHAMPGSEQALRMCWIKIFKLLLAFSRSATTGICFITEDVSSHFLLRTSGLCSQVSWLWDFWLANTMILRSTSAPNAYDSFLKDNYHMNIFNNRIFITNVIKIYVQTVLI